MRVLEHDLGIELALVGKRHFHFARALDDVVVGDDEAGRVDDDAGTERPQHLFARHRAEELAEHRIVQERIAVLDHARRVDVDDRGRGALDHRGVGQLDLRRRSGDLARILARV